FRERTDCCGQLPLILLLRKTTSMVTKTLTFFRSKPLTPLHGDSSSDYRNSSPLSKTSTTILKSSNNHPSSNGHQGNNSNGYNSSRGRGGYSNYGNRFNGEMSAAHNLRQEIHQSQVQAKPSVPVFPASAASSSQQQQQLNGRQEISEPATIIWCEGGIGEVMSPCVWRHPNLHLYFDSTETEMEGQSGWNELRTELEPGMELDVTFSLPQTLLQQLQHAAVNVVEDKHFFISIGKIADLRASRSSSVRTHEQAVVIAKRASGAAFLINTAGERTVLHPNFLPVDGVRHAILEKTRGHKQIPITEVDSPSSLCVLGRSLAVRLAPAPAWLPTIYQTDRGVTRWALSAEPYGEEKQGRAVVQKSTRLCVTLCPVDGDLMGKRTTLHAPIIQMEPQLKSDVQEIGSVWRFRACRELPGRSAVWRAFEITKELQSDPPISENAIESILNGNPLIDMGMEEKEESPCVLESSVLDDLAQLQHLFVPNAADAARTAAPIQMGQDDDVLVFDSIDDMLDSSTFVNDIFKAPSILPDEWMLLGVPPEEAIRTEQEMLLADIPRVMAMERVFGVYSTGDERPDMRVMPKKKKKRISRHLVDSVGSASDEEEETGRAREATPGGPSNSQPNHEENESAGPSTDEKSAKERKREMKEDSRQKKQLASIDVKLVTEGDDFFDLLHGSSEPVAPSEGRLEKTPPPPLALTATIASPVARAATPSPVHSVTIRDELFDIFHGGTQMMGSSSKMEQTHIPPPLPPSLPFSSPSLLPSLPPALPTATATPSVARAVSAADLPTATQSDPLVITVAEPLTHPRAPRFSILPYPERPRYADGWWFRRTRPLPQPVEGKKERRKKRREEEERRIKEEEDDASEADEAPEAPVRRPADNLRALLLGELKKKEEEKQVEPLAIVMTTVKEEERNETEDANVLVDLSPSINWSSPTPAAASDHLLHSPTELLDDLKDLF
ncbi:hypothetical protein PENTCL1PPCAC_27241, partial [Pristionchus entomophagus]